MAERIYQSHLWEPARDVTPRNFGGLVYGARQLEALPRFVREVTEDVPILSPAHAAVYLAERVYTPFEAFEQEEIWTLLLNTKNRVTHEVMVYRGTVNQVQMRTAELLREAVRVNAPSFIMSHCHPSGDPTPSPEDVLATKEVNRAARILDIDLLDHIIIGKDRWISLKERGLGFDGI